MSDTFLSRWARLKNESRTEQPPTPVSAPAPVPLASDQTPEPEVQDEAGAAPPVPDLPPVESLTKDSDFSAFLGTEVPDDLRRAALSRLWASDPLFTRPEVFDLHMEDYNAHPVGEAVKTAWKVGKGIVEELAEHDQTASFTDDAEKTHSKTNPEENDTPTS